MFLLNYIVVSIPDSFLYLGEPVITGYVLFEGIYIFTLCATYLAGPGGPIEMSVGYVGFESYLIICLIVTGLALVNSHLFNTKLSYHHASQSDNLSVLSEEAGVVLQVNC